MARRDSSVSNSSSISIAAVRSWRRASWVINPCTRAWAPKRGGLAGIWETYRILRRSGLIDPDLGRRARSGGSVGGAPGGYRARTFVLIRGEANMKAPLMDQ